MDIKTSVINRAYCIKRLKLTTSSSDMETLPTATDRHSTFFIWNLMVDFMSFIFSTMLSAWVIWVGNLPAYENFTIIATFPNTPRVFRLYRRASGLSFIIMSGFMVKKLYMNSSFKVVFSFNAKNL